MTADREGVAQQAPSVSLTGFPTIVRTAGDSLWRAHGATNSVGWYSSSGGGRFDLPTPHGTCYLASSMGAAIRERLGGAIAQGNYVTHSDATETRVTEIAGLDIVCGDVSTPEAARFGVTAELTSMTPYTIPHAWAAALHAQGLNGIRYAPRFTPGAEAWAIFGPRGPTTSGRSSTALTESRHAARSASA